MKTSRAILAVGVLTILGISVSRAEMGVAVLKGTGPDSKAMGTVTLVDSKDGLMVSANLANAPAGPHGFHIHEFGSCEDTGKAAGSHYNPLNTPHGHATKDGMKKAHAGDLGNVDIAADGTGKLEAILKGVTLSGSKSSVGGRALILHEKNDDFGQPVGNAGGRIGCGPIIITGK